jgi:16S rRNA (guanine(527)-N(7))-methyltransferase RsmG
VKFRELLAAEFRPYGELTDHQLSALESHYELLLKWNKRLNLTRIVNLEEAVRFHYCESLLLAQALPAGPLTIADLGSGAGFPGIPLAVLSPMASVTLIESDNRKAVFLREATRELHNTEVAMMRFESCQRHFDWCVSRAVAPEKVLSSGLAQNFALLMAPDAAPVGSAITNLPWGRSRALVIVSRGTLHPLTVPRETNPC